MASRNVKTTMKPAWGSRNRRSGLRRSSSRVAKWVGRSWAHIQYARRIEPTWLELNSVVIPVPGLPVQLDGLRVAHLSDFHLRRRSDIAFVRRSVEMANRCAPAVIALTGDFIHRGLRYVESIADLLGELHGPLGVFAVLGNHDYAVRNCLGVRMRSRLHLRVERALSARGIRVLRNEAVTLAYHGAELVVAGVEDLWSRCCDVPGTLGTLSVDVPRIVLAHNPRTFNRIGAHRCDLMLSGHTHGGQVNFRWGTPLLMGQGFQAGLYRRHGNLLYVNKGIGSGGLPVRYRTRPEVALFWLTSCNGTRH